MPPDEHKRHHDAVQRFIDREDRRVAFYEKVKAQVGGWAVIGLLGVIGAAVWHAVVNAVKSAGH